MRTLPIQGLTIKGLGKKDLPFSELKMDMSKATFVGATLGWIPVYFLSRNEKNWKIKQSKRWKKRDSNPVPTLDLCAWPIGRPFVDILHWQNFSLYQQSQDDYLVWQQLLHSLSRGLFNKHLQIRKLWIYSYGQILTVNLLIISKKFHNLWPLCRKLCRKSLLEQAPSPRKYDVSLRQYALDKSYTIINYSSWFEL